MYSSFENNEFSANAEHILVEKILKSTMTQHKKEYEILSLCLRYTFVFVNENVSLRDFFFVHSKITCYQVCVLHSYVSYKMLVFLNKWKVESGFKMFNLICFCAFVVIRAFFLSQKMETSARKTSESIYSWEINGVKRRDTNASVCKTMPRTWCEKKNGKIFFPRMLAGVFLRDCFTGF